MAGSITLGTPARLRRRLQAVPTVTKALQACRALLHFGPWRHAARAIIRHQRPPLHESTAHSTALQLNALHLNAPELAEALRTNGMAVAGPLPANVLRRLRTITDELPPGEYGHFHEQPDAHDIVLGEDVLGVVREYLGAEPEILECTLVVHRAEGPTEQPISPQRHFHFDYAGWHSLNLFVYLTDVDDDSGAHQVVIGTHRRRHVRDAIRPWIPDEEIMMRYRDRLRTVAGPAGTMFFEDTEAFHRRLRLQGRRVMLNVLYASHRSWLSNGRLTPKYSAYVEAHEAAAG